MCLGQNISFFDTLPSYARTLPTEEQIIQAANQLTFALAATAPGKAPEELRQSQEWLVSIMRYLVKKCPDADHTFQNIIKIVRLDPMTRKCMDKALSCSFPSAFAEEDAPSLLTEHLEEAVLRVLQSCGMIQHPKEIHAKIAQFLKDSLN